ncbi:MAG TPA: GDSL-type esterase/lipase family protein [Chitinophagaceae bacterium]|nr:G-D-S-L family lipolytic protein [Chitinophagaceae bacterium]MCB9056465.1 G-D-S-L family lipolytic protein [Chitinophagales bacterium]HPG10748.1 GDSL-type esterase/lipase family protein [Chitinophagaceae bacterium]HRX93976.1 GDSL-type esterase/lipase family protein [Chitinophagaceae bacterium]
MKKIFAIAAVILISYAFIPQKKTKVIFFGDSITELGVKEKPYKGYILEVEGLCKAENKSDQYDFIGSGISGNKVYDLYLRMEEDVLAKNPDLVIIFVGVNDVWHKTLLGTGTDADKFERFYQAILKRLKEKGIKAMLCTPAVVGEKTDMSNSLDGELNKYSNIIRDIAKRNNLPLIDLRKKYLDYLKEHNPGNEEKGVLTYDRVHMNAKGNQFLASIMWKAIKEQ